MRKPHHAHFILFLLLTAALLNCVYKSGSFPAKVYAENTGDAENFNLSEDSSAPDITALSAVLLEGSTGRILYAKDKDKEMVPASITKIMTLLLIMEKLEQGKISLTDEVTVSEHAASMGGSQVFLEPGESQTVDTMIKCISIASANDAAVAMAEYISGSEEAFVKLMNKKAKELGMKHTHFLNCNGLDDDISSGHYSSAYDVALMSRELIMKHPAIQSYTTTWMDVITHTTKKGTSEFGLTNTNKLLRTYDGITGLKTGSTSKAKYCLSATSTRNGMSMIAVIMAAPDHKSRFSEAAALMDYGYSNCTLYTDKISSKDIPEIPVKNALITSIKGKCEESFNYPCISGEDADKISRKIYIKKSLNAPVHQGDTIGYIKYTLSGKEIGKLAITSGTEVKKASYTDYLLDLAKKLAMLTPF